MRFRSLSISWWTILLLLLSPGSATSLGVVASQRSPQHADQAQPADLFDETIIRDFRFTIGDADWERRIQQLAADEYVYADLDVDGETYEDVGLRIKGNSSARGSGRKVPLNLTVDARLDGQEVMGYDTLNLNSGFANPTLAREMLTTSVLGAFQPMPKAAYVRVYTNGEYFGIYTLVQQIEGTFLGEWFESNDGVLFKGDAPGGGRAAADEPNQGPGGFRSNLEWLGEGLSGYRRAYELKTEGAGASGYEKLRDLIRVLDAPLREGGVSDAQFPDAIREVLDVDGALWYIAASNLYTNFDSYYAGHNYFIYWAEEDEQFHILSWDVNESFGVFPGAGINPADTRAVAQTDPLLMAAGPQASTRPLVSRLLAVPEFRADYLAHYRALMDLAFAPGMLEDRVTTYHELIRESVRTDPNYIYGFELFERNVWEDVRLGGGGRGGRPVPGLLKLANMRHAWLSARADMRAPDNVLDSHTRTPENPTVEDDVRIALGFSGSDVPTEVELVYRVDGSKPVAAPMRPEGSRWVGSISAQGIRDDVTYYARAVFADGRSTFHPAANQTRPWSYEVAGVTLPTQPAGSLVINELVADNETVLADEAGEYDDWLELYNRGSEPVGLSGFYLSDTEDDPWAYALPDVTLAPGGYYLVWCDNDPEQGENHADFRLSKDGESVTLSTQDATVDSVTFGALPTDASYMRVADGVDQWMECAAPTPLHENLCGDLGTRTPTPTEAATATSVATRVPTATDMPSRALIFLPFAER